MTIYFGIMHKDGKRAVGVSFPDLPGCYGAGGTSEEALDSATEALRLYAEAERAVGHELPAPRKFDEILADDSLRPDLESATIVAVPLTEAHTDDARELARKAFLNPERLNEVEIRRIAGSLLSVSSAGPRSRSKGPRRRTAS